MPLRRRHPTAAAALAVVLAALLAVTVLPASTAHAGGNDVAAAQDQMAAMRRKVEQVAAQLQAGTRAYQAGQQHLADVLRRERDLRQQTRLLVAATAAQQRSLDVLASAAYRRPLPGIFSFALAGGARTLPDALAAQADLQHVAGSQQDVLRAAIRGRLRVQNLSRAAEALSADARATERQLAEQLADLRRTAARANDELQQAATRLSDAQAAERARLAELARARSQAASRLRQASVISGPSCTGQSGSGYANGFLPDAALCPLWGTAGFRLVGPAAAAFNAMSQFHAASVGAPLCVTDSYRSYGEQVSVYSRKPDLAATPGTSEHGWGRAVDLCGGVERFGSDAFRWMSAHAGRFGFFHPAWAEPGGGRPEPWHWEYGG